MREREKVRVEEEQRGEGVGERERIPRKLCTVSTEPDVGLDLTDPESVT